MNSVIAGDDGETAQQRGGGQARRTLLAVRRLARESWSRHGGAQIIEVSTGGAAGSCRTPAGPRGVRQIASLPPQRPEAQRRELAKVLRFIPTAPKGPFRSFLGKSRASLRKLLAMSRPNRIPSRLRLPTLCNVVCRRRARTFLFSAASVAVSEPCHQSALKNLLISTTFALSLCTSDHGG